MISCLFIKKKKNLYEAAMGPLPDCHHSLTSFLHTFPNTDLAVAECSLQRPVLAQAHAFHIFLLAINFFVIEITEIRMHLDTLLGANMIFRLGLSSESVKVQSWVIWFISNCLSATDHCTTGEITPQKFRDAELAIIRLAQRRVLTDEVHVSQTHRPDRADSMIASLNPTLHED